MFDKQYRFKGRHAVRVDQLTSAFDAESKAQLFGRNIDVYTKKVNTHKMAQIVLRSTVFYDTSERVVT